MYLASEAHVEFFFQKQRFTESWDSYDKKASIYILKAEKLLSFFI